VTADIVIRKKHLGAASNDIGFKKRGDSYELIISRYDMGQSKGRALMEMEQKVVEIQNRIMRKYAEEKVRKTMEGLKNKGFRLRKRTERGNQIVFEYIRLT
jgi:hypothetical protein